MKNIIIGGVIAVAIILAPQIIQAQGTITYISNLGQTSAGSLAMGSPSELAVLFETGNNAGGYVLDSLQLAMADASGNASNFKVMVYSAVIFGAILPGNNLGTLNGSLNPTTAGIYTFTSSSNLTLSPNTDYFIVLTAGTTVANGAYEWSYSGANSYNPSGGWFSQGGVFTSSNGSFGSNYTFTAVPSQFAINATPIPEPGVLGLFVFGGLAFLKHRRKSKAV